MKRSVWTAPAVERAAATLLASLPATYRPAVDFQLLTRESGSVRHDLPIWVSTPHIIRWSDAYGPVQRHDVPGVQGAFVLSNVLAVDECEQILRLSEAMGYTEDAPVSLGRNVRRNENCVWLADDSLWMPIWKRVAAYMPPSSLPHGGRPVGLNQRWRLYKYGPDDIFRLHTDGSWPGSKADPAGGSVVRDAYGDRWSQLTFLIYLDDDYEGGETTFLVDELGRAVTPSGSRAPPGSELRGVRVAARGSVLCFYHGEHELSPLHEGSLVTRGVKHIVRSDVLYMLPGAEQPRDEL